MYVVNKLIVSVIFMYFKQVYCQCNFYVVFKQVYCQYNLEAIYISSNAKSIANVIMYFKESVWICISTDVSYDFLQFSGN